MLTVRRVHWLLFAALLLVSSVSVRADYLPRARREAVGLSPEKLARLDETFAKVVADKKLSGAVVLIARKDKVGYLHTFGMADVEANKPMKDDTIFRIASMTKPVTSVAVMMLFD